MLRAIRLGHLSSHLQEKLLVILIHSTQQLSRPVQRVCVLSGTAPSRNLSCLTLGQVAELRRFFAFVIEVFVFGSVARQGALGREIAANSRKALPQAARVANFVATRPSK